MKQLNTKALLAGAAIAGLFAGSPAVKAATASSSDTTAASAGVMAEKKEKDAPHECAGKNSCKGKGGCKTGDAGCKGKNSCKGKGGCATDGSHKAK